MKCEKCNNEAVFHLQSNINGAKSEVHLCPDCANKEGYGRMMQAPALTSFFGSPFGGLMSSFFRRPSPFDAFASSFFGQGLPSPVPASEADTAAGAVKNEKDRCANIPENAGEALRKKRELCLLRNQLEEAVRTQEFEKAAQLRDQIRAMEQE